MERCAESTTTQIVQAAADHVDADPLEMPPLYESIDSDALGVLLESSDDATFRFTYAGCAVTARSDGTVEVSDPSPDTIPAPKQPADD